jgi:hypothetical protein
MASKKRGANKKEVNLDEMVKSGPSGAYEALQLYRSRAIRFKTKNDINGAIFATASGAKCLLENGYENAGAELSVLFVELLTEANTDIELDFKVLVNEIDERFPKASLLRAEYLKSCIKWTTVSNGGTELGESELHKKLAECLWDSTSDKKNCYFHFAAGEAPLLLNEKIFSSYGGVEQQDLREKALTIGIVNFLALENLRDANELYYKFLTTTTSKAKNSASTTEKPSDLINFCDFLLQTCKRDAQPLFKQLVNSFASVVDFDENVPKLLMGPIAFKFFNIQPKVNPMMSMLQSMLA